MRKLVAALACRAAGTRLYGKPLQFLDLDRKLSVLDYMIQFLRTEPTIGEIVLGVAEGSENEPFHEMACRYGLKAIRGDQIDVLMRLIQCGEAAEATDVFRLTTESPFTYYEPIPEAWRLHQVHDNDVTSIGGLPDGPGFEIIKLNALRRSHEQGDSRHRSELCTLYIKEHEEDFRVEVVEAAPDVQRLDVRLTIDYPEDLVLCRRIYGEFRELAPRIPLSRIVKFWDTHPELTSLVKPYVSWGRWYQSAGKPEPVEDMRERTVVNFRRSEAYRAQVHDVIPGGAHTYSKGDDQFPALSPAAIVSGQGGRVWDLDDNEYVDCSMALGSVSLGHAFGPVLDAVREQLDLGANFQRAAAIELELAREFAACVPGAERVKFAKNGSTVTSAAVKLARAFTGRDLVAFPGNHPFYSYDDWFIGRTLCSNGVPDAIKALSVPYDSSKPETLERLFKTYVGRIACVITEPEEVFGPSPEALKEVVGLTRSNGALFIADEMVTGYRAGWPGACAGLGIVPDLSTWGKAIGNGFSFCALTGREDVMELGGIRQRQAPRVFLISTTHGGEAHALAAARAVLHVYQSNNVLAYHRNLVQRVKRGFLDAIESHKLTGSIEVHASDWRIVTVCRDADGEVSLPLRTLLLQEMIGRGVLFQGIFLPCYSHTDADVTQIVNAFSASARIYREALQYGVEKFLVGPPTRPVFRKYNGCEQVCPSAPCPLESKCLDNRKASC